VHAVALQAVGEGPIALVDRGADPGSLQTLGECEAADAASDDNDVEWFGHLALL
jgi:hypothetical protein